MSQLGRQRNDQKAQSLIRQLAQNSMNRQPAFRREYPAVADAYQDDWMEYVYMQQPCPAFVEGVQVKLETLDPNNNFYEIGTVTSDASGMYKLLGNHQYQENTHHRHIRGISFLLQVLCRNRNGSNRSTITCSGNRT